LRQLGDQALALLGEAAPGDAEDAVAGGEEGRVLAAVALEGGARP
jgi:hypothetical protein